MNWRDISNAPSGKPILSDDGLVIKLEDMHGGWAYCDRQGNTFACADNGTYYAEPTAWIGVSSQFYLGTKWAIPEVTPAPNPKRQ